VMDAHDTTTRKSRHLKTDERIAIEGAIASAATLKPPQGP